MKEFEGNTRKKSHIPNLDSSWGWIFSSIFPMLDLVANTPQ